jgi:UDP-glucose 4-epimerase
MILVTGASGFIGSRLIDALVGEYGKDQIVALSSRELKECHTLLHQDYGFDKNYFISAGYRSIKTIVHAGAYTPKRADQANDWVNCNRNIVTTDALLLAHFPHLERVIYLSTLDVYANAEVITEETPTLPVSLYGYSKLYGEKMILAWAAQNKKIAQVLRIGHVYGPGEEAYEKIIPLTMKKLIQGQGLQMWGTGGEIRSFIYIDDVISAIQKAIRLKESPGPVNIVGGNKVTIAELIQKLIRLKGTGKVDIEKIETNAPGRNLIFDNQRMKTWLLPGETDLDKGLAKEWEYMMGLYA